MSDETVYVLPTNRGPMVGVAYSNWVEGCRTYREVTMCGWHRTPHHQHKTECGHVAGVRLASMPWCTFCGGLIEVQGDE